MVMMTAPTMRMRLVVDVEVRTAGSVLFIAITC